MGVREETYVQIMFDCMSELVVELGVGCEPVLEVLREIIWDIAQNEYHQH